MSRISGRLRIFARALPRFVSKRLNLLIGRRQRPRQVSRILIVHHLLLGDTLMLTALLAALRARYSASEIIMTCPQAIVPLYTNKPYGVEVIAFNPHEAQTVKNVLISGPFDLGIVPGDNRHTWLALAADCLWIIAHAEDIPGWKNWPVDELIPFPSYPISWCDMVAQLAGADGSLRYCPEDWRAPDAKAFYLPTRPYVVLHLGASTPLKYWPSSRWEALAKWLEAQGYQPIWSAGIDQSALILDSDPENRYLNYSNQLDLAQLWQLLLGAAALVCPDTGVAHLGRLTNTPTLVLFGPGSKQVSGAGLFWQDSPFVALSEPDIACRDQKFLFRRHREWIRRCGRSMRECNQPLCMEALNNQCVETALTALLKRV